MRINHTSNKQQTGAANRKSPDEIEALRTKLKQQNQKLKYPTTSVQADKLKPTQKQERRATFLEDKYENLSDNLGFSELRGRTCDAPDNELIVFWPNSRNAGGRVYPNQPD